MMMMNKAQAEIEFARIAQERKCQTAWIHQVFCFANGNSSSNVKNSTSSDDDIINYSGGNSSSSSSSSNSNRRMSMTNAPENNNNGSSSNGDNIATTSLSGSSSWRLRALNSTEIKVLEGNGCHCSDWSLLRLFLICSPNHHHNNNNNNNKQQEEEEEENELSSTTLQSLRRFVTHTTFAGRVVLMLEPHHLQDNINSNNSASASTSDATTTAPGSSNSSTTGCWTHALPRGIHHNGVICDSILSVNKSWIWHNTIISNAYIASKAVVLRCGVIRTTGTTSSSSSSNNSIHEEPPLALTVGPESGGGRPLLLSAQATMIDVQEQLQFQHLQQQQSLDIDDANSSSIFDWNVIGPNAVLRDTATVESVYMHPTSIIEGAATVHRTILFPLAAIRGAACTVTNARLQWKACILSQSCISDTLLMECAEAGPQSIVTNTVLGPDTHVSAGEVHGSVLGPNTNAHHQSLVIGLLWPLGRGNVGYGANVGSNHTGRLPDQESCAGEGTFWGLSCVVVFPVSLLDAPYSIVAAGTTLKSQRLPRMPFSLLVNDNALIPAWVLTSSLYTLVRSELKFANRRKAVRHAHYTGWKIMRPEMIDLCRTARGILLQESQSQSSTSASSLSSLYKWSGKTRQKGIQAYTECIQRHLLQGLLSFLLQKLTTLNGAVVVTGAGGAIPDAPIFNQSIKNVETLLAHEFSKVVSNKKHCSANNNAHADTTRSPTQWPQTPWNESDSSSCEWIHQRRLLVDEFPRPKSSTWTFWVGNTLLPKLIPLENEYAERVFQSKARDDVRGKTIIPGYEKSHEPAAQDPVIVHVRKMALETTDKVNMILQQLQQHENKSRL
jgi:Domain of unknown function (DUF4954)